MLLLGLEKDLCGNKIMEKNYNHMIKNMILLSGKLISDYQIMTGKGLTDTEMEYIDEVGILPRAPKDQWSIPRGYVVDINGNAIKAPESWK